MIWAWLAVGCGEPDGPTPVPKGDLPTVLPAPETCGSAHRYAAEVTPVLEPDPSVAWRADAVDCPRITEGSGTRELWFRADGQHVGRASWERTGWGTPERVLSAGELGLDTLGCFGVLDGELLVVSRGGDTLHGIRRQGDTWALDADPLLVDAEGRRGRLGHPTLERSGAGYRVYLSCGPAETSGLCTATSTDGVTWTEKGHALRRKRTADEPLRAVEPGASQANGETQLFFARPLDGVTPAIYRSASASPAQFNQQTVELVLRPEDVAWTAGGIGTPEPTVEDGEPVLYFATRGSGAAIGRARGDCAADRGFKQRKGRKGRSDEAEATP